MESRTCVLGAAVESAVNIIINSMAQPVMTTGLKRVCLLCIPESPVLSNLFAVFAAIFVSFASTKISPERYGASPICCGGSSCLWGSSLNFYRFQDQSCPAERRIRVDRIADRQYICIREGLVGERIIVCFKGLSQLAPLQYSSSV